MKILTHALIGLLFMANIWCLAFIFVCDHPMVFAALGIVLLLDYLCVRRG